MKVPVTLEQVKSHAKLKAMALIKQSRLSVMPLTPAEFKIILELGKTELTGV
jgi:predicted RNA-binding protein with PUA-like domain